MQRILVLGCCGAGKSTFARALHERIGIPIIHLDREYWNPGWIETEKSAWEQKVATLTEQPRWIMDGNYGGSLPMRIPRADTIIYLDQSTTTCLWRITKRTLKYWRAERPDMVSGCKERFDLEFFHYVAVFNLTRRKNILQLIRSVQDQKTVHIFKTDDQALTFLNSL